MTRPVRYAPEAEAQLLALYRYIADEADAGIALHFTEAIMAQCDKLADFPERGTPRDDLRPSLRTIPFRRRATIAYAVDPDAVVILGIFYGGQDFETMLRDAQDSAG